MLVYSVTLPPPGASDVVVRHLAVTEDKHDGQPPTSYVVDKLVADADSTITIKVADKSDVTLVLTDEDDEKLISAPSEPYTFTVKDTIPPPQPGQPTVTLTGEE